MAERTSEKAEAQKFRIATFLFERENGAVYRAPDGFQVQLPTQP